MQAVDAAVLAAIRGSHEVFSRVSALDADGAAVRTWEGSSALVLDGSCSRDRTRMVRGYGDIIVMNTDGSLSPQLATDLFATGNPFRIERGVILDGARLATTLGTLVVTRFDAGMDGRLAISGEDRLTLLAQPFGDQTTVDGALTAEDALRMLWQPVLGDGSGWELDGGGRTVGVTQVLAESDDRLAATVQLMADLGLEVFADRTGNVVMRPIPDPTTQAIVHTFARLPGQAAALDLTRSGDRLPYNRSVVIVTRPDGSVFRAVADVTDPESPIHADRIGLRVGPIYDSSQIPDQASANEVATSRLIAFSLFQDSIGSSMLVDETLDESDVVAVDEPIAGADDSYRIEAITWPLTTGPMQLSLSRVVPLFAEGV
jgi:hypothetical protein